MSLEANIDTLNEVLNSMANSAEFSIITKMLGDREVYHFEKLVLKLSRNEAERTFQEIKDSLQLA